MTRYLTLLLFVALMIDPMALTRCLGDHTALFEYILGTLILMGLLTNKRKTDKKTNKIVLLSIALLILDIAIIFIGEGFRTEILGLYVQDLFPIFFLIVTLSVLNPNLINKYCKGWNQLLFIVSLIVIVCAILYNFGLDFLFYRTKVMGYNVAEIPFVCLMDYENPTEYIRPSWLFCEPSYLGFFLGIQLLSYYKYVKNNKKKWLAYMVVYIAAIIATNSLTGFVCSFVAILYNLISMKIRIPQLLLLFLLPIGISLYSTFDRSGVLGGDSERIENSSLGSRQARLIWGLSVIEEMNTEEVLCGKGREYIDKAGDAGVANVYLEIILNNGFIFLIIFMIIVWLLLKNTRYEFFFAILAFNITEIAMTPITLLVLVLLYFLYNQQRENPSYTCSLCLAK